MDLLLSVVVIILSKNCMLFIHCHTFAWTSATLLHCCVSGLGHSKSRSRHIEIEDIMLKASKALGSMEGRNLFTLILSRH